MGQSFAAAIDPRVGKPEATWPWKRLSCRREVWLFFGIPSWLESAVREIPALVASNGIESERSIALMAGRGSCCLSKYSGTPCSQAIWAFWTLESGADWLNPSQLPATSFFIDLKWSVA
jgi:hypothetical protein